MSSLIGSDYTTDFDIDSNANPPPGPCISTSCINNAPTTIFQYLANSKEHNWLAKIMYEEGIYTIYDNPNQIITMFIPVFQNMDTKNNIIEMIQYQTINRLVFTDQMEKFVISQYQTALPGNNIVITASVENINILNPYINVNSSIIKNKCNILLTNGVLHMVTNWFH
jgi:hypothetical protein